MRYDRAFYNKVKEDEGGMSELEVGDTIEDHFNSAQECLKRYKEMEQEKCTCTE